MFRISKEELKILKKKILQTDPLKTLGNREETLLFYFNYKKKLMYSQIGNLFLKKQRLISSVLFSLKYLALNVTLTRIMYSVSNYFNGDRDYMFNKLIIFRTLQERDGKTHIAMKSNYRIFELKSVKKRTI